MLLIARKFLSIPTKDLVKHFQGTYDIKFEDGVVVRMTHKELIISRYFWDVTSMFSDFPIKSSYTVTNYLKNGLWTGSTINKFLSVMLKDLVEEYLEPRNMMGFKVLDEVWRRMYKLVEKMYSELTYEILDYSISMNIKDLLEIQLHPELMKAMERVKKEMSVESILDSHSVLDKLMKSPEFENNPVSKAYNSGMVNANQMKQVLAARGFVTEIDSSIFKYPVASSFTLGLNNLYDVAVESRSAAKALFLSNKAIQDSEYFARKLHILTMVIEQLEYGDCGSTDYLDWYVTPPEFIDGKEVFRGDIPMLVGKYYLDKDGVEKEITLNDTHLYGTTIKLRTVLYCKHPDKHKVCSRCFGKLSIAVHEHANLGHFCATTLTQKITQSILSTKHLSASADVGDVVLTELGTKFFIVKNHDGIALKPELLTSKVKIKLIISQDQCYGIKDLRPGMNVNTLNAKRVTKIDTIGLAVERNGKKEFYTIEIKNGNRLAYMDLKLIEHILETGYDIDDFGNYVFDITDWKSKMPLFKLPKIEFDFAALGDAIEKIIKTIKINKDGIASETPQSALSKMFELANSKLFVNIAMLEVIIASLMVKDLKNKNFDIGRGNPEAQIASMSTVINNRSMGGAYGYDNLLAKLLSPSTYDPSNKPDHPLDVIFAPNEVIKEYKTKGKMR